MCFVSCVRACVLVLVVSLTLTLTLSLSSPSKLSKQCVVVTQPQNSSVIGPSLPKCQSSIPSSLRENENSEFARIPLGIFYTSNSVEEDEDVSVYAKGWADDVRRTMSERVLCMLAVRRSLVEEKKKDEGRLTVYDFLVVEGEHGDWEGELKQAEQGHIGEGMMCCSSCGWYSGGMIWMRSRVLWFLVSM